MKSLKILLFAAVATILAACTKDDGFSNASYESVKALEPVPVAFGTYMGETPDTRTFEPAATGAMTTDGANGTTSLQTKGFGVFAYYTETTPYDDAQTSFGPNFMYNEKVSTASWTYSPLKYWPNDFNGAGIGVDNGTATGTKLNYLSFFAYAPWVGDEDANNAFNGSPTTGITGLSANDDKTDPTLTFVNAYKADGGSPTVYANVDVLWGTAGAANYTNVVGTTVTAPKLTHGLTGYTVNANYTKQKTGDKINFAFKHALAKFGSIKVIADVDAVRGGSLDSETKITVKSVTIKSDAQKTTGTLNLATGVWTLADSPTLPFTYNVATGDMVTTIAEPTSTVTAWTQLDPISGVPSGTAAELLADAQNGQLMTFFPGQQPTFTVTIDYFVRTRDTALKDGFTTVEQVITNSLNFAQPFELNKMYNLTLHLGMTSVKFTATVEEWVPANNSGDVVDLPVNVVTPPTP